MSRIEIITDMNKGSDVRSQFKFFYDNKFFNLWMKKFKIGGMDYQEAYYLMKKFWYDGTAACSRRINIPEQVKDKIPFYVFTPWVMAERYNCYDFPTHAMCINTRSVSYINTEPLEVDKDIVLMWCQANHKGIFASIEPKLKQLVDIEMVIRICTKNQKAPWVVGFSPEDKKAMKQFVEDFESDEPMITTMLNDLKNTKALVSAAPYVVDKLEAMRQKIEDDIKTMIGVSNVGIAQKKEHFTDDEVQTNNKEIEETNDDLVDEISQGFERCNSVFGTRFIIELAHSSSYNEEEEQDYKEDESDE